MGKKFYIVIFCVLTCSVLLLGMSYSKNSNDSSDTGVIENNTDTFRVVYSTDSLLSTKSNNNLRISLTNKRSRDINYALYLKEIDNDIINDVYYSINDSEEYILTDNVIYLGKLSSYGTNGDMSSFNITLRSNNDYSFYYSVAEYDFVDEVPYGS